MSPIARSAGWWRTRAPRERAMLALMAVFAWLSFRDAVRFRRSGRPGDVSLQLPERLQRRIHEVMRRGLRRRSPSRC